MKTYFVVTGVVMHKGRILLLKKADDDYNYPGKWSFCSGFVKEFEAAEDTVLREIKEETGLDARIVKSGGIVQSMDHVIGKRWVVWVFLCETDSDMVTLCLENQDHSWVEPSDLEGFDFVPGLSKNLKTLNLA